jgi:RNA polymerase sigma-70 factor (ECF subfamily)
MDDDPATRASLLVRLRDPRDERAWSEFVAIYGPLIDRLARRKGLQEADAADLAQDVFGAVARAIERGSYDPQQGSFRGWLFTVARNLMINSLAAGRRHPRGSGDTDFQDLLEAQPEPSREDSALFEAEYRRRLFDWALERIRSEFTEPAWRAFRLAGLEGRPGAEVAEILGTTVGTVYYHKSRVMARLRCEVERLERAEEDRET